MQRIRARWACCASARFVVMVSGYLRRPAARDPLFIAGFALAVLIGRLTMQSGTQIAMVWPAAGVGVLWLLPYAQRGRWWSDPTALRSMALIVLTTGVTNVVQGTTLSRSVGFAVANLAQALVTALVFAHGRSWNELILNSPHRLHRLLLAAVAGAVVGLPFGPGLGVLASGASSASLWQYIIRNVVSVFLVGLIGLLLMTRIRSQLQVPTLGVRLVGITVTSVIVIWLVLLVPESMLLFVLIPLGMFVAYWTEPRTTAWHSLAVSSAFIIAAVNGLGPLNVTDVTVEATMTQAVVLVLSVVSMTLVLDREEKARLLAEVEASRLATLAQAQLMERLVFSISDGVLMVGRDGEVIVSNPAARRMLGIADGSAGEPLTLPAYLVDSVSGSVSGSVSPWEAEEGSASGPIQQALQGRQPAPTDVVVPAVDDVSDPTVLSVTASSVDTVEGTQAVVLIRNVTAEREHTAELVRFAGVVAHDLLNPLTSIRAWFEVVVEELGHAGLTSVVPMVNRIHGSAERMQQLIDDLLDYSVTRKGDLVTRSVEVASLIEEIVQAGAYDDDCAGAAEATVAVDAAHSVDADPGALRQVLTNIISNAVKYTPAGATPAIEVRTDAAPGGMVAVSVADRGIGIPAGQERDVFREFHRVPDHASAYPGTGLGLAICRRIVERHGGTIEARRRPGGGSVFRFTVPAAGTCDPAQDSSACVAAHDPEERAPAVA